MKNLFAILILFSICAVSCVSNKKYKTVTKSNQALEQNNKALQSDTATLTAQVKMFVYSIKKLNAQIDILSKATEEKTGNGNYTNNSRPAKRRNISVDAEYKNKSFFIFNFTRYIEWPIKTLEDFTIGVIGNSPITEKLRNDVADKKVNNRKIKVKEFSSSKGIEECHIVFISAANMSQLSASASKAIKSSILVITESDGALEYGSHINFMVNGDDIVFSLNKNAMNKAKLKVSPALLNLAK